MGVTNIQDAKLLIQSSKTKERLAGLKDLIHILKHNRGKPSLEALGNKAYLALCEALFQCLRDSRAVYLREPSKTSKKHAPFPVAALALRQVIATGVRTIKSSTVELTIDAIIEILPDADGALLEPLLEHIPKTLRSLLEYQPHVERLSKDCWDAVVDFCSDSVSAFCSSHDLEEHHNQSWSTSISSRARTPFDVVDVTSSRASPRPTVPKQRPVNDELAYSTEDFIHCLHSLVKAPNAPVLDKAEPLLRVLLRFLQQRTGRGNAAVAALSATNALLSRIALQSLELTKRTATELLPLMKSMWSELILREEIMIALTYTEPHISSLLADPNNEMVTSDLEALIETIYGDYRKRQETTAHQFLEEDHLCFCRLESSQNCTHPLHAGCFSMSSHHTRFEGLWSTVLTIARFSFMLDHRQRQLVRHDEPSQENVSNKRPRVAHLSHEYLRHLLEPRSNAKRAALHVIAFMAQEGRVEEEHLESILERLVPLIADENPVHAVWAMIGLAEFALQTSSATRRLESLWINAWQAASRVVTSASTCRAACHLMNVLLKLQIVTFSAVTDFIQAMLLSIELSGPALLTESSAALLTTVIQERVQENPTNFSSTAERILSWLFTKWTPSYWADRTHSSSQSHHSDARDVLRLLHTCLDKRSQTTASMQMLVLGPLGQARATALDGKNLARYLLLLEDEEPFLRTTKWAQSTAAGPTSESYHLTPMEARVIDFYRTEAEKARTYLEDANLVNVQGLTSDMLRTATNLCIVTQAVASLADTDDHRTVNLQQAAQRLTQSFAMLLQKPQLDQYKVDAILETCMSSLPGISSRSDLTLATFQRRGLDVLAAAFSYALKERQEIKQSFYAVDDDFMDIDEENGSQPVNSPLLAETGVPRCDVQAASDIAALRASCTAYLHLIASLSRQEDGHNEFSTRFVGHLVSVPENDLLRLRSLLHSLWDTNLRMSKLDCLSLLERCSEALVDPRAREYNTSEVANGMLVEVLIGATSTWELDPSDRELQDLYENVEALYAYYIKDMEKGGVRRSPKLQKVIATFLHGLLRHRPDFAQNRKLSSVRTTLFQLLSYGEMEVKYHIALQLPAMFEDFILSEHEKILQDVDSSLPETTEGLEAVAVRLLVLSKLAAKWHTLLRPAVYLIFASSGSMNTASVHAKRCISIVANARKLESSQSLFRLFASQIIFSWLDGKNSFADIPFAIFGYESVVELLRDVEAEATGQAMMRGHQEELRYLAEQLDVDVRQLLLRNIGKAAAYTIAWDTCNGASRDKAEASNSNLLRDLVGHEQYFPSLSQHFPSILGCMFQTSDHEERISEALERKTAFHPAAQRLTEIASFSQSEQITRIGMQPAFSAFYMPDQLERLCRRTVENASSFWTASRYTFVLRSVLDRIHPALGSLYARSIIRKIRIIVALAGSVAFEGYPLQMTLQSLRPFLTDSQCAEDATGIMQYLFKYGSPYLKQQLSFVTGIGLSILISLRVFMGASQDSTTQQSQHVATMNAATRFHTWFSDYLSKHVGQITGVERGSFVKAFSSITTTASRVQTEGNSVRGSEESKLLLEILEDVRTGRRLLNKTSREVALDLLCRDFRPASTARDDILGLDQDAANYASLVWESCQRPNVGDGYLLWSAKVLGRAYSGFGEVQRVTGQSKPWKTSLGSAKDSMGKASRDAIIKEVVGTLYSDIHAEVSLAEGAIRTLLAHLDLYDTELASELYRNIPETISTALTPHNPEEYVNAAPTQFDKLRDAFAVTSKKTLSQWIQDLAVSLCQVSAQDPLLGSLTDLLCGLKSMAEVLLPYLIHLVLLNEFEATRHVAGVISAAMVTAFQNCEDATTPFVRVYIQSILYLRSQPVPQENTRVDRDRWLQIDLLEASRAACLCGMYRSALLLAESSSGQTTIKAPARRSSVMIAPPKMSTSLQLSIYKNLDEPDSFYGIQRDSTLLSVLDRLEYEGDGVKSLLFRGARLDSQIRRANRVEVADRQGTIKSLIMLNMNGITNSLLSNDQFRDVGDDAVDGGLSTARKLNQWDVRAPELNHSESSTLFKAFQGLHLAKSLEEAKSHFERQLLVTMNYATEKTRSSLPIKTRLRTLAVLTEADEVIESNRSEHLLDTWDHMKAREKWMRAGEFNDVRQILSCRESLFSTLGTNTALLNSMHLRAGTVRNMESESLVASSAICRKHGALPEALASVTYLSDIVPECKSIGLDIEAVAMHEVANVLWEQGEAEISIRMREHLIQHTKFDSQKTDLNKSVLQARLGHHLAEARLAKPNDIMQNYLEPAIEELKGEKHGVGPGQVFHEFALFCDKQIQSTEAAEDMERIRTVMDRKLQEYHEFMKLAKADKSKSMRETYARSARRAKGWYDLDNAEYERLRKGREQFLRQCLENYLSSLAASDEYDNDALRVFSLWLEYAETDLANDAVESKLKDVPSGKFALLMNQLSSRLQSEENQFQKLLVDLVTRICIDHPYHGMHQIFAIQMKVGSYSREDVMRSKDESARSRQRAAVGIANILAHDKKARSYWSSIFQSNELYHHLAMFKGEKESTQQGREIPLDRYKESRDLIQKVPKLNVPPATLQIEVRPNMNYNDLPRMHKFKQHMSIANGLSAPKVVTAIGTDGKPYKQLFKSGNDDLRQDAIMEQVFDQVSRLLKNHTATRIRNLGIRTYKVLPLSTRSGLMEFVQNTIPLHLWVMPAHERYFPTDYKPDRCRKEINNCQQDSVATRMKVWQKVADNFHPVMRYFLLERFEDPDEWFERRLAYTRSTAAISILGHVLGLGDRHCHNILLDEKSGEIVHIDLGVSFEAGRVLPVPEVVPFRLTRDLVDAMGFTKTEGVFRRCCEFTLDTLREERESIMTLLNVLRYDPLVNWSITPNKAKRMQEGNQDTNANNNNNGTTRAASVAPGGTPAPSNNMQLEEIVQESNKKKEGEDQAGEAGRALSVVEKKLSKTLSTKAMVNELIQQATDEKNLAVLYMGWASYA